MKKINIKKIRIRINIYLLIFIAIILLISISIYFLARNFFLEQQKRLYYDYKGYIISFRRPAYLAYKIQVFPNESILNISTYLLALGIYENITIVILENDNNEATAIQAAEIIYKIKNILEFELKKIDQNIKLKINLIKLKKELSELNVSNKEYYVFLKSYLFSNETYVRVHRLNLVEISGKNLEEFDLATIRFLINFLENMKRVYK